MEKPLRYLSFFCLIIRGYRGGGGEQARYNYGKGYLIWKVCERRMTFQNLVFKRVRGHEFRTFSYRDAPPECSLGSMDYKRREGRELVTFDCLSVRLGNTTIIYHFQ